LFCIALSHSSLGLIQALALALTNATSVIDADVSTISEVEKEIYLLLYIIFYFIFMSSYYQIPDRFRQFSTCWKEILFLFINAKTFKMWYYDYINKALVAESSIKLVKMHREIRKKQSTPRINDLAFLLYIEHVAPKTEETFLRNLNKKILFLIIQTLVIQETPTWSKKF
jgi:hypothetical protein